MISRTERELPSNSSLDTQNDLVNNKKLPHGVAPETYGLLLFARDHKEILDKVDDLDKGTKAINLTRNLLYVYYFNEVSGRDLEKFLGGDRKTNARRILKGLEVIWQNIPLETQLQYPKEKALQLKTFPLAFPQRLKKMSEAAKSSWQDEEYRKKNVDSLKKSAQIKWNKYYGMEPTVTRSEKRNILIDEWLRLTKFLGHTPSRREINKLKKENNTRFSQSVYKEEFGQGSFTKAKEILASITSVQNFASDLLQNPSKILKRSVLEKDIKTIYEIVMTALQSIVSAPSVDNVKEKVQALNAKISQIKEELIAKRPHAIDLKIGNEKEMWTYAVQNNLLPKILQTNILTQQEIDSIRRYFENGIIADNFTETVFNRFTIAVAKVS